MNSELDLNQLKEIIFALENQKKQGFFNPAKGKVSYFEKGQLPPQEILTELWELPPWGPADGFRLMREFALQLDAGPLQNKLLEILESGHGVFRHFKNALHEYGEISRQWFHFKEKSMAEIIVRWYSSRREEENINGMGPEPEETGELILSDVTCRDNPGQEIIRSFRDKTVRYIFGSVSEEEKAARYALLFPELPRAEHNFDISVTDPEGQTIAVLEASGWEWENKTIIIKNIFVERTWRGLGIANLLLDRLLEKCTEFEYERIEIRLPHSAELLKQSLIQRDFHIDGFQLLFDSAS